MFGTDHEHIDIDCLKVLDSLDDVLSDLTPQCGSRRRVWEFAPVGVVFIVLGKFVRNWGSLHQYGKPEADKLIQEMVILTFFGLSARTGLRRLNRYEPSYATYMTLSDTNFSVLII